MSYTANIKRQNPSDQLDLFDALKKVAAAANVEWMKAAADRVKYLCQTRIEFTADDVWQHLDTLDVTTSEPRAMGAVMENAAKAGWCRKSDRMQNSRRRVCHARPVAIWYSCLLRS